MMYDNNTEVRCFLLWLLMMMMMMTRVVTMAVATEIGPRCQPGLEMNVVVTS